MFDCILPLSHAQQGVVYTSTALDPACDCFTCKTYPVAYLHHILKVKEFNISHLAGLHNLHFYFTLLREMRSHIKAGTIARYYADKRYQLDRADGSASTIASAPAVQIFLSESITPHRSLAKPLNHFDQRHKIYD